MAESSLPELKRFPKERRLLSRRDFEKAVLSSRRVSGRYLVLEISPSMQKEGRLGITVTKKYGSSPKRNRFKRLCREVFRLNQPSHIQGVDLHMRPKISSISNFLTLDLLTDEFLFLLELYRKKWSSQG